MRDKSIKLDERICAFLLGSNEPDQRLRDCIVTAKRQRGNEVVLPEGVWERLQAGASTRVASGPTLPVAPNRLMWLFQGPSHSGKRTAARAICTGLGVELLIVDVGRLVRGDLGADLGLDLVLREAGLRGAALYFHNCEQVLADPTAGPQFADLVEHKLPLLKEWCFFEAQSPLGLSAGRSVFRVDFAETSVADRVRLWQRELRDDGVPAQGLSDLSEKFRLTGCQVRAAVAEARALALAASGDPSKIDLAQLQLACRSQSHHRLAGFAQHIKPRYIWDDIVLPQDHLAQLREICNYLRHRQLVLDRWGYGKKLVRSRGINALFAGPSGTGKTMAAEIIAGDLGLELYRIDLAMVVSKYIGETEKNLDRVFREGRDSNAILFFDEADAIFGKRSEVRDSHDRYANIEIAYLLVKMEDYDGLVVLATNLRKNIDEAFVRRLHFAVEFPFPDEDSRLRIWPRVFPPDAPLSDEVDLRFMARQFKVSGGNIRNIALGAAFLAADEGSPIRMEHLIRSTKREYQKMGKLCVEADFGRYYEVVRAE